VSTGACGVNCDLCRLRLLGTCSTCGSGKSREAEAKRAAQERLFGQPCPVLACAIMNKVDYCLRDCLQFPCDNFSCGPYPFSRSFLDMQQRRLAELPPALDPNGRPLNVPQQYWETLAERDTRQVCNATLVEADGKGRFHFRFLDRRVRVTPSLRVLEEAGAGGGWHQVNDPLLELTTLTYLTATEKIFPLANRLAGIKDLKQGFYFQGRHVLPVSPLLERFGDDPGGFADACRLLEGVPAQMADLGFRLLPFPRLPVYFLYWQAADDFRARIDVLFDCSVENIFTAPAIWILVRRMVIALLQAGRTQAGSL